MSKTIFSRGTPVTAEWLNAINNPQFTDTGDNDGEIAKIVDANLSSAEGQILDRVARFQNTFEFRQGTGRVLQLWTPNRILSNGNWTPGGQWLNFNLPANASGEIWLNWVNGTYVVSNTVTGTNLRPATSLSLCTYSTDANTVVSFNARIPAYRHVDGPITQSLIPFGGRGLVDGTWNAGQTISDERYSFNNLDIVLGGSPINISRPTLVQVAGNLTISGNGLIVCQPSVVGRFQSVLNENLGAIFYNALPGQSNSRADTYSWTTGSPGNSGPSGSGIAANCSLNLGGGGSGGSFIRFQVAGNIRITGNLTLECVGNPGESSGSNFSISNTGSPHRAIASGGGGGSGGLIHFQAGVSIVYTGNTTFDVRGGRGGDGFLNSNPNQGLAVSGGGGGGGWIIEEAPTIVGSPTYILNAGNRGTDQSSGSATNISGGSTGAGYGGRGGLYFLSNFTVPNPAAFGDFQISGLWWYRPARPGQQLRLLRYPIILG